jgi:hypothetical protein
VIVRFEDEGKKHVGHVVGRDPLRGRFLVRVHAGGYHWVDSHGHVIPRGRRAGACRAVAGGPGAACANHIANHMSARSS